MASKFNRLLSNLPFNPSLIGKVSFYAKRLRQESSIRRLGFIFIALAMFVQTYAAINPPKSSISASPDNDLIVGGIGSAADAVWACNNNVGNYRDILYYYGISCDSISHASTVRLNSHDYNNQLFSMGRQPKGIAGETPVNINGTNYWLRYLWGWGDDTYTALQGKSDEGKTYFILFDCGNLVFIGLPSPALRCKWGNPFLLSSDPKCFEPCPVSGKQSISKNSSDCFEPCPYNNAIDKDSPSCKPCDQSQTRDDKSACLELSKKVRNDTQNIDDANGTTAKAGDLLVYTLSAKNKGKADIDDFVIQENLSDILDYADVVTLNGGTQDSHHNVSWPAHTLRAGVTIEQTFSVKVKSPIPQTPVSSSDPGHFDLTMTNVYGNAVSVKLPAGVVKKTEKTLHTLPNTGPGSSLIVGFSLTAIVAYFFMRTRLMSKELELVRSEYNSSGSL